MSNSQFYNSATSSFGYSSLGCYNPMSKNKQNDLGAFYPGVQIIPTYDAPGYDSLQHGDNQYGGGHFNYKNAYGRPNGQGCNKTQAYKYRPCGPCKQVVERTTQEPPYVYKPENSLNNIPRLYDMQNNSPPYIQSTMNPSMETNMPPSMMQSTMNPYMETTMNPSMMQSTMNPYMETNMPPYMETNMPPYMETTMNPYM